MEAGGPFDVVIASDVAALPYADAYDALVETFYRLTTRKGADDEASSHRIPSGCVYLCSKFRHFSETNTFLPLFKKYFNVVALAEEESIHPDFRHGNISMEGLETYTIYIAEPKNCIDIDNEKVRGVPN